MISPTLIPDLMTLNNGMSIAHTITKSFYDRYTLYDPLTGYERVVTTNYDDSHALLTLLSRHVYDLMLMRIEHQTQVESPTYR